MATPLATPVNGQAAPTLLTPTSAKTTVLPYSQYRAQRMGSMNSSNSEGVSRPIPY